MSIFGSSGGDIEITPNPIDEAKLPFYRDFLNQAFQNMQAGMERGPYQGRFLAGLGPIQQSLLAQAPQQVGTSLRRADALGGAGAGMLGAGDAFRRTAGFLSGDMTGDVVRNAGAFINNPVLQGQIDAASRDVVRNLREETLPGINMAAAGTGNVSSSRAGIAEGIARRGAADRIGDISAAMRGRAYDTGVSAALQGVNQRLAANQQMGQAFNLGQQGILGASSVVPTMLDTLGRAGAMEQAGQQVELDEARRQHTADIDANLRALQQFFPFLGLQSGGFAQSVDPGDPGAIGRGLGYASTAAGIYSSLFGG